MEQALVLGAVVGVIAWLATSTAANLEARGIATGFRFLWRPARLGISESWIGFVPGVDTYARVVAIGLLNTLLVSALAIVISTVIGVIVGLSRLSFNWLQSRCAGAFVELVRSVPLPLQLLLWYQVLLNLPAPRNALSLFDAVRLSNRGLFLPAVVWTPTLTLVLLGLALGICVLVAQARMARGRGAEPLLPPLRTALALGLALPIGLAALGAVAVDVPVLRGFNFQGGLMVSPELAALVLGLSLYAAAFTAEIVRAGSWPYQSANGRLASRWGSASCRSCARSSCRYRCASPSPRWRASTSAPSRTVRLRW